MEYTCRIVGIHKIALARDGYSFNDQKALGYYVITNLRSCHCYHNIKVTIP
jgi:hypothetical protein